MDFALGVLLGVGAGYLICDLTRDRLYGIKTIYNQLSPIESKIDNMVMDITRSISLLRASLNDMRSRIDKLEGKQEVTQDVAKPDVKPSDGPSSGA